MCLTCTINPVQNLIFCNKHHDHGPHPALLKGGARHICGDGDIYAIWWFEGERLRSAPTQHSQNYKSKEMRLEMTVGTVKRGCRHDDARPFALTTEKSYSHCLHAYCAAFDSAYPGPLPHSRAPLYNPSCLHSHTSLSTHYRIWLLFASEHHRRLARLPSHSHGPSMRAYISK